jgi:hypothetical protein
MSTNEHESTRIYELQNTVGEPAHPSRLGDRSRPRRSTIAGWYSSLFIRVFSWLKGIFPA